MRGTKAKLLRKKAKASGLVSETGYVTGSHDKPHIFYDAKGQPQKGTTTVVSPIRIGTCVRGLYQVAKKQFGKGIKV